LDLQLPVQSVPITTKVVSSNTAHGEVPSIQHTFRSHKINGIDSKRLGKKYIIIRDSRDIAFLSLNYWFSLERTLEIQCSALDKLSTLD
jgi:hypothetical protein